MYMYIYIYIHLYYLYIHTFGACVASSLGSLWWSSTQDVHETHHLPQINPAASQPKIPWKCSLKPGEAWCWQGEVSSPSPTWKEEKHCHAHNGSDSHDGQHLPDTKTPCPVSNQTQLCGVQTGKKCMQPKKNAKLLLLDSNILDVH